MKKIEIPGPFNGGLTNKLKVKLIVENIDPTEDYKLGVTVQLTLVAFIAGHLSVEEADKRIIDDAAEYWRGIIFYYNYEEVETID